MTIASPKSSHILEPQKSTTTKRSTQCWAHCRNGKRCKNTIVESREGEPIPIPYCTTHLKHGDGALKVVSHPIVGKVLIARYTLPKKYRMAFIGIRGRSKCWKYDDRSIAFYPPDKITGRNSYNEAKYNGVLIPNDTGDVMQYASCPGPNERQNIKSTFQYFGKWNCKFGGLEFVTIESIEKGTQLCHWYGAGWWNARKGVMKRCNVGTKRYPAPLRLR